MVSGDFLMAAGGLSGDWWYYQFSCDHMGLVTFENLE